MAMIRFNKEIKQSTIQSLVDKPEQTTSTLAIIDSLRNLKKNSANNNCRIEYEDLNDLC